MYKLNLPECDFRLRREEGKVWIFDTIRKKFVVLTPEEWVRQHFVNYLITQKQIPRSIIRIEGGLIYNELQKRSDIVVYDREGRPWLIVECKSPTIAVSPAALAQVALYNSKLQAAYICITNGLVHLCANIHWKERTSTQIDEIPLYPA